MVRCNYYRKVVQCHGHADRDAAGVPTVWPVRMGPRTQGFFIVGTCLLAGMAAALTDWHTLSYVLGGLTAAVLPTYVLLPESPRWLLTRPGREAEAFAVLRYGIPYIS